LDRDIRALLPDIPFRKEHVNARDVLTEESLEELKAFLESNALTKPWSINPRLYALLRMSAGDGEEDLTERPYSDEELLAHGLSDYALPFSEATLPTVIREQADTARRILNLQSMVKSSPESMSFNDHILTHRNSKVPPFRTTTQLPATQGSFGHVESVINTRSGLVFARKIMTRPQDGTTSDGESQADRQWRLKHFKNEVEILQKLDHRHLVRFCGSYTDENTCALLVQPVAERTLHDLLIQPNPLSAEDRVMMRESFGCLAFGLAWLHSRLIRHKDIKPANILISSGSMLFCDFGSAMDAELRDTTRTEGPAHKRTPRYVSPETHEEKERNEASDVWSLGCVFLEVLAVLTGSSVEDLLKYIHDALGRPGLPQNVRYWEGSSSAIIQHWIAQTAEVPEVQFMAECTRQMVSTRLSCISTVLDVKCTKNNLDRESSRGATFGSNTRGSCSVPRERLSSAPSHR
jgi:serine/threonine protein kinase